MTTAEHPFYTRERGWVEAGELRLGEHVRRLDGGYGTVLELNSIQRSQRMYNLTVETAHTFFVGDGKWLVHNAGCGETFKRLGTSYESASRLERKASEAEAHIGIHGVSVTAGTPTGPASQQSREVVEQHFRVVDTPSRRDPASLAESKCPFSRIIALDYYDGPISGAAQCAQCSAEYRFEMLAWDDSQDVRIYSLAPLPPQSVAQLTAALSETGPPSWPVWVPIWKFVSEGIGEAVGQEVQRILDRAGSVELVIASEDSLATIMSAKQVTGERIAMTMDWFSFLNLK